MCQVSEESKVRLWIWGGFLSVLVVLAVVGGVSYFSFEGTVAKFGESSKISANTVRVLSADRNVTSFRRYAEAFLTSGDESALKHAHERVAEASEDLRTAIENTVSAERRQLVQRLRDLLESFSVRFDQAVKLREKKVAAIKEADAIGHKGRDALDEFNKTFHAEAAAAEATETLMRARLDLARIAGLYTEAKAKEGLELAATLAKQVREMGAGQQPDRRAKVAELTTIADGFAASLAGAIDATVEMKKLTDEVMEAIGKEISATSTNLRGLQAKRQKEIDEDVGSYVLQAKVTIGTLTLIAMGVGVFCAILISTMVSRPIKAMATAARVAEEIGELIKMAAHDGDFRNRTPTEGRTGFVATISTAVNRLFDSVCEAFGGISRDANTVALAASDASGAVIEVNAGAA